VVVALNGRARPRSDPNENRWARQTKNARVLSGTRDFSRICVERIQNLRISAIINGEIDLSKNSLMHW
jgi:hypothetical protein